MPKEKKLSVPAPGAIVLAAFRAPCNFLKDVGNAIDY
jgi:hypothetical protein